MAHSSGVESTSAPESLPDLEPVPLSNDQQLGLLYTSILWSLNRDHLDGAQSSSNTTITETALQQHNDLMNISRDAENFDIFTQCDDFQSAISTYVSTQEESERTKDLEIERLR